MTHTNNAALVAICAFLLGLAAATLWPKDVQAQPAQQPHVVGYTFDPTDGNPLVLLQGPNGELRHCEYREYSMRQGWELVVCSTLEAR